jgi:hypothetical protein
VTLVAAAAIQPTGARCRAKCDGLYREQYSDRRALWAEVANGPAYSTKFATRAPAKPITRMAEAITVTRSMDHG